jgi:hypothetical protein
MVAALESPPLALRCHMSNKRADLSVEVSRQDI